jgi:Ser/Thr protein kinase RdoA (MazF antagonist)
MTAPGARPADPARLLGAWSEVFRSPDIAELAPGRVWAVTAARGDRYVLKQVSTFGAADPLRRFAAEARILAHLLQRGVPVAVPVLSDDGRAAVTDEDGALHAVFPMLPRDDADDDPGLDPVLYQNIGAAIARLHLALAGCPFGIDSWVVGPGLLPALWRTATDRLPADAVTGLSARVRPHWEPMARALSAPAQRIHGDVHGGNLLTSGQEVTGIIDCDHLPLAPRAYDLGYYLAFAVQWRMDEANQPAEPAEEAVPFITRQVLSGYHAVARLTRQEREGLPALALLAALGLIVHFVRQHDLVEETWLRTACWIGDNFDALRLPASALCG